MARRIGISAGSVCRYTSLSPYGHASSTSLKAYTQQPTSSLPVGWRCGMHADISWLAEWMRF